MIQIRNISKTYSSQVLLEEASLQINPGEKIGLVGRNGHGKTTLLRLLAGQETPDGGEIQFPREYRLAYVQQNLSFSRPSVLEETLLGLPEIEKDQVWQAEKILSGLGFSAEDMQLSPERFSGGYQVRINLAKVLLSAPDLLLLDEPNNYLDIVSIRWMVRFLRAWKKEFILVTHDRSFMDQVVTHTAAIYRKKLRKTRGNTAHMYEQIAQEEEVYEKTRVNDEKERKRIELFISRFRAKARLANMVQSRIKTLAKKEKLEMLSQEQDLDFCFHYQDIPSRIVMEARSISFTYAGREDLLIPQFSLDVQKQDRIAIIGRNGKGKSTLLRLLAGGLEPLQGDIKTPPRLETAYFAQTNLHTLTPHNSVEEEIAQAYPGAGITEIRSICGAMMFEGDAALKKISVLSGGEKNRVMLGKIIAHPAHLLLLDEPTNHLDMQSCDSLLEALDQFPGAVIMVTHNEMYLRHWARRLIIFEEGRIRLFEGSYEEFLEGGGWEEERQVQQKDADAQNPKEIRRIKAERLKEARKILAPLEQALARSEQAVHQCESELAHSHEQIIQASTLRNAADIEKFSRLARELEQKKERLYQDWEQALQQYEQAQEEWETD